MVTAAQPNITGLGTLSQLAVNGNVTAGNISANNTISAAGFSGQINTAAQPNITSVGTLSSLTVSGNITGGNLNTTGTVQAGDITVTTAFASLGTSTLGNTTIGNVTLLPSANIHGTSANLSVTNVETSALYTSKANINSTTDSSNSNDGAMVVKGGVGINKNLNVGGQSSFNANVTVNGNLFVQPAGSNPNAITVNGNMFMLGIAPALLSNSTSAQLFPQTVTTLEIGGEATTVNIGAISGIGNTTVRNSLYVAGNIFANIGNQSGNVTINSNLSVQNSIFAFANIWTYGNLTTYGSVFSANTYTSGNANVSGAVLVSGTYAGTRHDQGSIVTRGGLGVAGNINSTGTRANIYSFATTTGANTGALVVQGGTSVGGNLFVGGDATISGNVNFQAFLAASINGTPIGNATPSSAVFTTIGFTSQRPQRRPTMLFDFANGLNIRQHFWYTRNSQATYFDATGNLVIAANNMPRIQHDSYTLLPRGILLEESRQNLFVQSNSWGNASVWSNSMSYINEVTSATTSPSGEYNAYVLQEDNNTDIHQLSIGSASYIPTMSVGTTYTASLFVKPSGRNQISLVFYGEGNQPIYDLQLGTCTYEPSGTVGTIQTLANGWYRISTTITKTNNTNGNVSIVLVNGTATTYQGDNTSGVYIYGMQVEPGSFATSYIPNTLWANTRAADSLTLKDNTFVTNYQPQRSTVLVDAQLDYRPSSKLTQYQRSTLVSFNDGTVNNRVSIVTESLNSPTVQRSANLVIYSSGVFQNNIIIATANLTSTGGDRISAFFRTGLAQASIDGNTVPQVVAGTVPSNVTTMTIGSGPGTPALNGTIRKVAYYPEISTGEELNNLSAP